MSILSLLHAFGGFLVWFAPGAIWGALNYALLLLTRGTFQACAVSLTAFSAMGLFFFVTNASFAFSLGLALLVLAVCIGPACLEKRSGRRSVVWDWHFLLLLLATYQSVAVGMIVTALSDMPRLHISVPREWVFMLAGCALAPPAFSMLRFMWVTSRLRPGLDVAIGND